MKVRQVRAAALGTYWAAWVLASACAAQGLPHQELFVTPEKIEPSAPRPDDFDEFWAAKIKELEAVPANPQLESAESGKPDVEYWKITMDNVGGGKIHGQLARPAVSRDAQRSAAGNAGAA